MSSILANLSGLVGGLLLAVPVWHVARYGLKAAYLAEIKHRFDETLSQHVADTQRELEDIRDTWSKRKTYALVAGTALSILSYAIPLAALALA